MIIIIIIMIIRKFDNILIVIIIIIMWDFSIGTDHEIEARRLDLLIIDKRENNCQIIE